jgi:hypothetical protein
MGRDVQANVITQIQQPLEARIRIPQAYQTVFVMVATPVVEQAMFLTQLLGAILEAQLEKIQ